MKVLVFDIRGKIAHYRRPDTTGTHSTYPVIPRTVLHGLLASVMGREKLEGENWTGIELKSPVRTVSQQVSMLGKGWLGGGKEFNRPTAIELVIKPSYRIYYTGDNLQKLTKLISEGKSYYHTYLGSAYCLTYPEFVTVEEMEEITIAEEKYIECSTVVPSAVIEEVSITDRAKLGRVGGMYYKYLGERKFSGTVSIVYDMGANAMKFKVKKTGSDIPVIFARAQGGNIICLW